MIFIVSFNDQFTENITVSLRVRTPGLFKSSTNQIESVARSYPITHPNFTSCAVYKTNNSYRKI